MTREQLIYYITLHLPHCSLHILRMIYRLSISE